MSKKKSIDTLVEDIYKVFTEPHKINEKNLEEFGENMKSVMRIAIEKASEQRINELRMSVIGKPDRQLWYEIASDIKVPPLEPNNYLKFLYGDIVEQMLVFLIKESGHTITHMQREVELGGVLGHTDGVIDGIPCDIKSSSNFQFRSKWLTGALLKPGQENDPFGYIGQLSGYRKKLIEEYPDEIDSEEVAWVVMNKEAGDIHVLKADIYDLIDAEARVEHLKNVLDKDTPPPQKCYPEVPDGKSGNMSLHKNCTYCKFKETCWQEANLGRGLRAFKYSNGIKYLTRVNKLPKVDEIT
jgi:hypothetical protein